MPVIFSLLVLSLCLILGYSNLKTADLHHQEEFSNFVNQTQNSILKRFALYEASLKGGLGLFNASNFVSLEEWRSYVETLKIDQNLPGINGLGYVEYTNNDDLQEFLDETRKEQPDFKNHPVTNFKDKFVIKYIVPEDKNLKAIGLDIGFENNRRKAAEAARDTGYPRLTKKIILVQDDEKLPGFLLLVPFYKNVSVPSTLAEKRELFDGWVYAPFIAKNFLNNLDYSDSKNTYFEIYDGQYITSENLIYKSKNSPRNKGITKVTRVQVAGNTWTIKWQESTAFSSASNSNLYYYLIFLGIIASIITYFVLSFLISQKAKIQRLVDRKTSELSQSQKFLYLIMNTIPDRVFVKDKDFKIVRANETFMSLYPPEKRNKVIGHTTVENFPKIEAEKFLEQDRIAFENGVSQVQEEITIYTGETLTFLTTKVKFFDDKNDEYILGISRDITDLIDIQKSLEQKVEERTQEYKEQKILAEKAGEAKEEFLATMSHELRTPLNSIIGLTNIITDDGNLDKEQSDMMSIIQKASHNLLITVNDILDISKIESGNVEFENKTFNLSGLLYSIIDQCKPLASQKGLLVHHNLPDLDEVYIEGDEHKIMRVITNLTSNAIRYTNEGEIDIQFGTIDEDGVNIEFVCSVADTGIGIPEDKLEAIFDKFSQAQESTERLYGGTGLGLSITKELVTLMGGDISVKSEVGKGSVFTVKIPFPKSSKENEAKYAEEYVEKLDQDLKDNLERIHIKDARILIAEDHEFNRIFISKLLTRLGNNNHKIVENGALALNTIKKDEYDLILMDCNMPVMNGYESSTKIREYEDNNNVDKRVVISAMTADVMPGTRERCLNAGMNEYLTKPLEEDVFKSKLSKWIVFEEQNDNSVDVRTPAKENKTVHVNLSLLDEYTDNDFGAKKELIKIFYDNSLEDLETLKSNCNNLNKDKWASSSHRLKGSSSYIGAAVLKNLCAVAESGKFKTPEERQDIYMKIKKEHENVCKILKQKKLL